MGGVTDAGLFGVGARGQGAVAGQRRACVDGGLWRLELGRDSLGVGLDAERAIPGRAGADLESDTMMKSLLVAEALFVAGFFAFGCATNAPPAVAPTAAPAGPSLRGGTHTVPAKTPFTVVADTPDLTNVDLLRLYQDGALWHQLPVAAVVNKTISFPISNGLDPGTFALSIRAVNAEPSGETESNLNPAEIVTLTVVGTPPPPKFQLGQRIVVYTCEGAECSTTGDGAAVRQPSFGFTSPVVGIQPAGKAGAVLDGPQSAGRLHLVAHQLRRIGARWLDDGDEPRPVRRGQLRSRAAAARRLRRDGVVGMGSGQP